MSFSDGFSLLAEDARGRERGERTARELWVREGQERPHAILALGKAGERHFVVAGGRYRPGLAGAVPGPRQVEQALFAGIKDASVHVISTLSVGIWCKPVWAVTSAWGRSCRLIPAPAEPRHDPGDEAHGQDQEHKGGVEDQAAFLANPQGPIPFRRLGR